MAGPTSPKSANSQGHDTTDQLQRKRMQNRLAQRTYRERLKRRIEDLEKWRYVALSFTEPSKSGESPSTEEERFSIALPISPPLSSDSGKESLHTTSTEVYQPDISIQENQRLSLPWDSPLEDMNHFDLHQIEQMNHTCNGGWRNEQSSRQEDDDILGLPMPPIQDDVEPNQTFNLPLPTAEVSGLVPDQPHSAQPPLPRRPSQGKTAFHLAAEAGQISVVSLLLQRRIDPNNQDGEGRTALHLAVKNNHLSLVQMLIRVESEKEKQRTDVNIRDYQGRTALHLAVLAEKTEMVELLLGVSSIELEAKDEGGQTVLHHASVVGNGQIVKALLTAGADILMRVG